ncbi:MAG TPA: EamA family transporter [Candidatus Limnocylindrales bacterium]
MAAVPPELLIVAGALSVQGGAGLATRLIAGYGALPVVAMRIGFSALLLAVLRPPRRRSLPGDLRDDAVRWAVLLGVVLAAMNAIFYVAISRIPLGVAVTIEFWGPLAVAVTGSRRLRDLAWVVLAAAGIYLLAGGRLSADDLLGVAAAFVAGGCWATYILAGGRVARLWPDGRGLSLAMLVATAVIVPVTLLGPGFGGLVAAPLAIGGGLVVALFSSAIPYTLEIAALGRVRSATFGVLMSLEPAIAALVGLVVLGQLLDLPEVVAIGLVAVASAGASLSARGLEVAPGELEAA